MRILHFPMGILSGVFLWESYIFRWESNPIFSFRNPLFPFGNPLFPRGILYFQKDRPLYGSFFFRIVFIFDQNLISYRNRFLCESDIFPRESYISLWESYPFLPEFFLSCEDALFSFRDPVISKKRMRRLSAASAV